MAVSDYPGDARKVSQEVLRELLELPEADFTLEIDVRRRHVSFILKHFQHIFSLVWLCLCLQNQTA